MIGNILQLELHMYCKFLLWSKIKSFTDYIFTKKSTRMQRRLHGLGWIDWNGIFTTKTMSVCLYAMNWYTFFNFNKRDACVIAGYIIIFYNVPVLENIINWLHPWKPTHWSISKLSWINSGCLKISFVWFSKKDNYLHERCLNP